MKLNETLGPPHYGNFLGLFQLLAKKDPVLNEIKNRIIWHRSKQLLKQKSPE